MPGDTGYRRFSRRGFMGLFLAGAGLSLVPASAFASLPPEAGLESQAPRASAAKKPLVVYFSHSGHTRKIAQDIHKKVGGDLIEIETENAYPDDYQTLVDLAKKEQRENARPKIKTRIPNLNEYGIVFLGYPNWWSGMPMPVYTFIEENKLDGKTIAPFSTHGGGGLGHSVNDLKKEVPHSKILKPLSVPGNAVDRAEKDVLNWIEGLGPALIETTTGNTSIYPDGAY